MSDKKHPKGSGMVANVFNPNTQKVETGGSLWVQDQTDLSNKFQSQRELYSMTPFSKQITP